MPLMFPTLTTFLFYHGAAFTDLTTNLNDFQRNPQTLAYTTSADYLYIGRDKPFSDLWVELVTPNTTPCVMTLEYWNGTAWTIFAIDLDDTQGFTRSGWIRWNKNAMTTTGLENSGTQNWKKNAVNNVTKNWIRLSFSQTFGTAAVVQAIGIVFSDDQQLVRVVPDLMNFLPSAVGSVPAWASWILSHVTAKEIICQRLRTDAKFKIDISNGFPYDMDEWDLHRIDQIREAAKWLALGLIYQNMATSKDDIYFHKSDMYMGRYADSWKTVLLSLDFDNDGLENPAERVNMNNAQTITRY